MVNCHASIKGLFGGMIFFSFTMISIILYAVFRNKIGDTTHLTPTSFGEINHHLPYPILINTSTISYRQQLITSILPVTSAVAHSSLKSIPKTPHKINYSIVILEIVNLCLLVSSLCATMWSLLKIRKLNYRRTTTRKREG
jgi:hypothetical protein